MTKDKPNSVADRLTAELAGGGELVDEGGFDIDATRGLDKLAQFVAADPHSYVLRWAEAGLIAGVTQLRFDIGGEMLAVSFDHEREPIVIPSPILEGLLGVLVNRASVTQTKLPRELLVQLALGVIAALGLAPRYLSIESVGADGSGVHMLYGEQPQLRAVLGVAPGTRIYLGLAGDIGQQLAGAIGLRPEHELLREHCRHATTPIFLDRRRISQRPVHDRSVSTAPVVHQGRVIGKAGFVRSDEPARAQFFSRGLLIETLVLDGGQRGFVAAIDLPLPRDLSRTKIARTPELDAVLAAVYQVHRQLLTRRR